MIWSEWLSNLSIQWSTLIKVGLEFLILVGFIYFLYTRFARQTQADRLLRGLFILLTSFIGLWGLSHLFNLPLLETVFGASIQLLIIGLIVIFQPELRRLLVALGQAGLFQWHEPARASRDSHPAHGCVEEIRDAVRFMSRTKTGALIVLEPPHGQHSDPTSYLEAGVSIGAVISSELLLTIFHPNTPLHDGAVVIDADCNIKAAGVLLPLTEEPNLSWRYGTRHRAAIGLSEITASHCVVVSEETGSISYVAGGTISKITTVDELVIKLKTFYQLDTKGQASEHHGAEPTTVLGNRVGTFITSLEETLPTRLQQLLQSSVTLSSSGSASAKASDSSSYDD